MSDKPEPAAAHQAHPRPTPTPYPEVNAVVHNLLTSLHSILGAQLAGMYVVGSLALGDFDPRESDLDLLIVTVGTLSDETIVALRDLHRRLDHGGGVWTARLDAIYMPEEVVRQPSPLVAAAAACPLSCAGVARAARAGASRDGELVAVLA